MKQNSPHIAMLPSPGMGHIIPMVEFAKRLSLQHNLSTTLIIPNSWHSPDGQKTILEALPKNMNQILLPPPINTDHVSQDELTIELRVALTIPCSLPSIREAVKSLIATTNLVALVVDLLGTAAFVVAKEFSVPPYIFFPSSAMALSLFLHLPRLDDMVPCDTDFLEPFQIPGCSIPLSSKDNPFYDRHSIGYKWFLNNVKSYKLAEGIIVNSFDEMEAGAINALQEKQILENPPVYPVGPLVHSHSILSTTGTAYEVEDSSAEWILKWLDDQRLASILFICFGSLGSLSHAQIHELALGIEMSEKGFLWVARTPSDKLAKANFRDQSPFDFLPEGFVERIKGKGLLVSNWAPQARILGHESTGGFLTHCGWNSILESVVNGVPMIAWPLFAEQKMNAALLSEDLKIALRPQPNGDGLVAREVIASTVKNLMDGEEGKQLRRRIKHLKDAAAMVLSEDGSSTRSIAEIARKWMKNC